MGLLSVTQPGAAIANVASDRISPVHSCNECYIGEIVQCATISQRLFAHLDAAGTSELSDVAGRSQEDNRRSGHASSVDGMHWLVGASMFYCWICWWQLHYFYAVLCYLKGCKMCVQTVLGRISFHCLYLALLKLICLK